MYKKADEAVFTIYTLLLYIFCFVLIFSFFSSITFTVCLGIYARKSIIKTLLKNRLRAQVFYKRVQFNILVYVCIGACISTGALKQTNIIFRLPLLIIFFETFLTESLSVSTVPSGWLHRGTEPAGCGTRGNRQNLYQGLLCPCLPAGPHRGFTLVLCWLPLPPQAW